MSRIRRQSPPSYCHHKASGQAVVRLHGKDHYLGPYGSAKSHTEYARIIAEWRILQAEQKKQLASSPSSAEFKNLTIAEVMLRYREFASSYYSKNGIPTKEFVEMKHALRPLRELYGDTFARDFGPLKLKAIRQQMIEVNDLSRGVINNRVKRIKRFFKWAVGEELVPSSVSNALRDVDGLRRGRTSAREAPPVKPVEDIWVDLVLPHLSPQVAALVQVQRLTGCRPGEVVLLRACDIDRSGDVWIYEPQEHKNQWREQSRIIPLGPKAQAILNPYLVLPEKVLKIQFLRLFQGGRR
ncbi:Site-specific tyrosine recombinase XerC [Planctomycetales bacterium 10988]|nr:Site-specific tyrosine recombinase XerC [Planctomycetales bacterium 10988]